MSGLKETAKLPIHTWPIWKAVGGTVLFFLPFSAALLFVPPYFSPEAFVIATAQILAGVVALNWGRFGDPYASEVAGSFIFMFQFLVLSIRAWAVVVDVHWSWVSLLITAFFFMWALPLINPKLSHFLWQEQIAPQTKFGRRMLAIMLALLPSAGVLGGSVGLFASRFGEMGPAYMILASLFGFLALLWSQYAAHHLLVVKRG